ncbi:NAD(P)-dependent oxidoreductase [Niallia circulans]|uniref:Gfo/Idh/MocA family protein n=1 Tax=Niallia TaxID=2837506 RepID=UPI000BA6D013|nr:Gfo/Idh/MocA family oxidoreductase [Niallia circulans]PAD88916.1 NAD(P)-dependent oxidoreductase [Niallia circulans]
MKLGIVGAGKIVQDLLPMLKSIPQIDLVAIFGRPNKKEFLLDLQKEYPINKIYVDYKEMLADTDIDVVYIALPNHLHYSYTKLALEARKHVICEKPFTSNLNELKELERIAQKNDLYLIEAITNQYRGNFLKIKELLPKLGDIKVVEANYSQYSSRYDAFKEGNILPAFNPEMSGGALMDINSYNIHFVVGLFGKPMEVQYYPNLSRGIDTSGVLILEYERFKAICIGSKDSWGASFATIQGDNGFLTVDGPVNSIDSFIISNASNVEEKINKNEHNHRMYEEFVAFEKIIREKNKSEMLKRLEHSLQVMEILTVARKRAGIVFAADKWLNE